MTFWLPSYLSSLTPMTMVMSSSLAGAEMMTFLTPDSVALGAGVVEDAGGLDHHVDADVAHGSAAGPSLTANALILWLPMWMVSPSA